MIYGFSSLCFLVCLYQYYCFSYSFMFKVRSSLVEQITAALVLKLLNLACFELLSNNDNNNNNKLTNSMAYGTRSFNATFTRALQ